MLLSYDANGGHGHRDHVKVHHGGTRSAELAGTPRLLEATMPREVFGRLMRFVRLLRVHVRYDPEWLSRIYCSRSDITHAIDLRRYARRNQAALAAHRSEVQGTGRIAPAMRALVRMPAPVFGLLLGREWFVEAPPVRTARKRP